MHDVAAAPEYVPARQPTHEEPSKYEPAVQPVEQTAAPGPEISGGVQAVHEVEPAGAKVMEEHWTGAMALLAH